MTTRLAPLLRAVHVAALGATPAALAAQSTEASIRVTARVAPPRSVLALGIAPVPRSPTTARLAGRGTDAHAGPLGAMTVRAAGRYEVVVRRPPAGEAAGAAPIWTRDLRGTLRPLAPGGAVVVARGRGGSTASRRRASVRRVRPRSPSPWCTSSASWARRSRGGPSPNAAAPG